MILPTSRLRAVALAGALTAVLAGCGEPPAPPSGAGRAPGVRPQVSVVTVQPQRLAMTTELPGRVAAAVSAEVRPQVTGIVQKRLFTEGSLVRAGELLYQIDPSSYAAAVDNAEAALARAEATHATARLKAARQRELALIEAVSRQDADDAEAALKQAEADVAAARAAVRTQRIQLGYTRVTAPVAGRIGRSAVTPGALATANQATALATIQQLDPIYVDVTQPSTALLEIRRSLAAGQLKQGAAKVRIVLEDGSVHPEAGVLQFSEAQVDASTGSVTLRARVPNPRGDLLPGMYARAVIEQGVIEQAITVPQAAVERDAAGQPSVMVVGDGATLQKRSIRTVRTVGSDWLVADGLKPGDVVAVAGQQKVPPGAAVNAQPLKPATGVAQR